MNANLTVTLVGALVAVFTLVAGFVPPGPWRDAFIAIAAATDKGPIHDLLLLLGGAAVTAGFGPILKGQRSSGDIVTGRNQDAKPPE